MSSISYISKLALFLKMNETSIKRCFIGSMMRMGSGKNWYQDAMVILRSDYMITSLEAAEYNSQKKTKNKIKPST